MTNTIGPLKHQIAKFMIKDDRKNLMWTAIMIFLQNKILNSKQMKITDFFK